MIDKKIKKEIKWFIYETLNKFDTKKKCYYKYNTVVFKGKNFYKVHLKDDSVQVFVSEVIDRKGKKLKVRNIPIAIVPYSMKYIMGAIREIALLEEVNLSEI